MQTVCQFGAEELWWK